MKKLKISLRTLFNFLEAENAVFDAFTPSNHEIFVKTPLGEYTKILGVVRKFDEKCVVTTETGKTVNCGMKHIFIDEIGNNVLCKDATTIQTLDGVENIISKEISEPGEVFDIAIEDPNLYVTPNGMIHHNTSFIRGYLTASQSSAIVTYDEKILGGDSLFSDFVDSESNTLVIEDADMFLSTRESGNSMMHKFLNVGDGLVTVKGKKIIFSTNLPSVKDIDPALLRAGRCFAIQHFDELTRSEADKLIDKLGIDYKTVDGDKKYSIAEIFSGIRDNTATYKKTNFGFC